MQWYMQYTHECFSYCTTFVIFYWKELLFISSNVTDLYLMNSNIKYTTLKSIPRRRASWPSQWTLFNFWNPAKQQIMGTGL